MVAVSDDEALGRRERKKRATRLALKLAALDLVAERGFANVTVEDIADAVDVSERTFFNYFASKEAAVIGDDPELIEAMRSDLVALPVELSPLAALRTVLMARIRDIEEDIDRTGETHAVWLRRFAVARAQPEVLFAYTKHLAGFEQALTDGLVERLGGDEGVRLYASLVTAAAIAAVRVSGVAASEAAGSSLAELAAAAFDLLAEGFVFDGPLRP